ITNFAATSLPLSDRISPTDKASSKIIDAFSNSNYVFVDVSVEFRICNALRFLRLGLNTLSVIRRFLGERLCQLASRKTKFLLGVREGALFLAFLREVGFWQCLTCFALGVLRSFSQGLFVPLEGKRARCSLDRFELRNVFCIRSSQLRELAGGNKHAIF